MVCLALSVLIPTVAQDIWEKTRFHLGMKTEILPVLANSADSPGVSEAFTSNVRFCLFFCIFSSENIPLRGKIVSHGTFIASIKINSIAKYGVLFILLIFVLALPNNNPTVLFPFLKEYQLHFICGR